MNHRYAALILAAGLSSRMGQLKLLLPLVGGNTLESTTDCFSGAGLDDIYVVTGHESDRIRNSYRYSNDVHLVYNAHYKDGMFTSVMAGICAMGDDITAFLMMPGDCPLVSPDTVRDVITEHEKTGAPIVRPTFNGRPGHPCLISMQYKNELLGGEFPQGMRTLMQRHAADIVSVPITDEAVLWDMDTAEQYEFMVQKAKKRLTD